ncbi:MAG: sigma-54-dependent Fis family transcriptional regulator [Aestuariibacter sp.]|nr:sigma-54-dependent Fis family transcriptional regulator [Aestuariibacter sp.]MCP4236776.1 sigma-54-dependent Fis family transcriptional regulator [Aestuariibacter sp.]MCP4528851.1 sigma-54-dependent Fis family transcriptional regulator [Aestuariibacter sp.]
MTGTLTQEHAYFEGLSILLVDSDRMANNSLQKMLTKLGSLVTMVGSLREAELSIDNNCFDAVVSEDNLSDGQGLALISRYLNCRPNGAFYLVTEQENAQQVKYSTRQGARHVFVKPLVANELVERILKDSVIDASALKLSYQLSPYLSVVDPLMINALVDIPFFSESTEPVLITGKSGTGKELVARAVHGLSSRSSNAFVPSNCGSIPESMLETELFGHEKGAFTSANSSHRGCFEQAHKGTLFLDEIGEMSQEAQTRLLRVLEHKTIRRVGGEREIPVDVRVVAATHRDLAAGVEAGNFREDLFYRLNVLPVSLPPLCERPLDIENLSKIFLKKQLAQHSSNAQAAMNVLEYTKEAMDLLKSYHWPGNVRELRNIITRLAVRLPKELQEITADFISYLLPHRHNMSNESVDEGVFIPKGTSMEDAEWMIIDAALKQADFNRAKAAELLGIGERTLRRKLNGK